MTYKEMLERLDSTIDTIVKAEPDFDAKKLRNRCKRVLEFAAYGAPDIMINFQRTLIEDSLPEGTPETNSLLRGQLNYWIVKIQLDDLLKKEILKTV